MLQPGIEIDLTWIFTIWLWTHRLNKKQKFVGLYQTIFPWTMFDRTRCGCNYSCFLRISLLKPFVSIPKFQFSCRRNRILGLSCICLHPSCPQPWPVFDFLADEEHPHSMVLPSPCFAVLWGWCYQGDEHCWVLTKVTSLCHVKNVHFCFIRPEHHACWDYKIAFLQMVFDFF